MRLACNVPDNWNFNSGNPCLYLGGNYNQNQNYGLFYVNYTSASNSNSNIGSRLHRLANRAGAKWHGPMARRIAHPLVKMSRQDMSWYSQKGEGTLMRLQEELTL